MSTEISGSVSQTKLALPNGCLSADKFKVIVLQDGYSFTDETGDYKATGTSSLIKGPVNVLVDTGGPWDSSNILQELSDNGVTPDEINYVVGTHGHSDHVGNLNLFLKATHIVGFDVNHKDTYFDHPFKEGQHYSIYKNIVEVIPTPGHMHHDVSVIVRNVEHFGTIVLCGDLFECENDKDSWKEISESPEEQEKNRRMVLNIANYIVPGHGPMFKVNRA